MKAAKLLTLTMAGVSLLCPVSYADPAASGVASQKSATANAPAVGPARPGPRHDAAGKTVPDGVHSLTVKPSAIQPAGPLLTKAPEHGSAPAIITGQTTPKARPPAAVSGTGLNRKP